MWRHLSLMEVGEQNMIHQGGRDAPKETVPRPRLSCYSPVDCRREDGVFVLEIEFPREKGSVRWVLLLRRDSPRESSGDCGGASIGCASDRLLINLPCLERRSCGQVQRAATPNVVLNFDYIVKLLNEKLDQLPR
jgi:hypothetical protein